MWKCTRKRLSSASGASCKRVSSLLQAHKALLATQSDYFRVMFTADMRERDQDKIHMKGLTAAGFGHILRFMYYGSLELSMPTVQEILQVTPHTHSCPVDVHNSILCFFIIITRSHMYLPRFLLLLPSLSLLPVPGRRPCTSS